jgi:hypothetical protein
MSVTQTIRRAGVLHATRKFLRYAIPGSVFDIDKIVIVSLDLATLASRDKPPEGVRWAGLGDLDLWHGTGIARSRVRHWMTHGARVIIRERDGRLIGCNGLIAGRVVECALDWMTIRIGPGDVWSFMHYVAPDHRGKGAFDPVRNHALAAMHLSGKDRMLAGLGTLDIRSFECARSNPVTRVGSIFYVRLMGLAYVRFPTGWRLGRWNANRRLEVSDEIFDRRRTPDPTGAAAAGGPMSP